MTAENITDLYKRCLQGTATPNEQEQLLAWIRTAENEVHARELLSRSFSEAKEIQEIPERLSQSMLSAILSVKNVPATPLTAKRPVVAPPAHRVHFLKTSWFRYAAILLLLAGTATFLYLNKETQTAAVQRKNGENTAILPGGNKAVLTLADGRTIVLDSAADGALALQGTTRIIKLNNGALAYNAGEVPPASATGEVLYNTISTPRGGQYQLTLPDGTKVWLNAVSSINYPVDFTGNQRKVKITGEAYFEVTSDLKRPFLVSNGNLEVQVLGTQFNMNTYDDETDRKVTLLEGSVRVIHQTDAGTNTSSGHNAPKTLLLTPGQQAQLTGEQIKLVSKADLAKTIAWKNGLFNFEDATLEEVMRQLTRWYNIKVSYEKNIPTIQFWGKMNRNTSLAGLLKNLGDAGVHYRIIEERRELIILP